MSEARALYYPYSRCVDETTLKRMVLVFDEVWFIDPVPRVMREGLMTGSYVGHTIESDWQAIREDYDMLVEKGIARLFDPTELVSQCDKVLTAGYHSDVADDGLWRMLLQHDTPESWHILKERVPPSLLRSLPDSVAPGYISFAKEQARFMLTGEAGGLVWAEKIPAHVAPHLADRAQGSGFVEASAREIFDNFFREIVSDTEVSYEMDTWARDSEDDRNTEHFAFSCEFNYLGGSSLSVNQSLIASDLLDASLVTDSGFHHQILCNKYKAACERSQGNEELFPALNLEKHPAELAKLTYVTQRVTELFTPTEQLQKLTIQQCVELREASADSLFRLRQYLAQLTADIESEPWDRKLELEVTKIIDKHISPEATRVRDQLEGIKRRLFGSILTGVMGVTVPSLLATIFPAMSASLVLLFGGSAVAGGTLAVAVKEIKETVLKSSETKRNGLMFFIGLENELARQSNLEARTQEAKVG